GRVVAAVPGDRLLGRSMAIEVGLFGFATLLALVFDITPEHFSGYLVIGVLACTMGLRNASVRRLGVPDISTVVMTMTLTALTADSPLGGGHGEGTWRRRAEGPTSELQS